MEGIRIALTAATNVGLVRQNNEDNFIVCPNLLGNDWLIPQTDEPTPLGERGCLLVVADGMGGANAGEVASAIAVETVQASFAPEALDELFAGDTQPSEGAVRDFLTSIVVQANANILAHAKVYPETEGMGTTIVICWILSGTAYIAWCGDSRCYVYNPRSGLTRLSRDHSLVQELVEQGQLTEDDAFDHPYSNIITRCLGDNQQRAKPDFRPYTCHDGDVFLLCSDGLCGLCRDEEIVGVISAVSSPTPPHDDTLPGAPPETKSEEWSVIALRDSLIEAALAADGHDNVTVALCRINGSEDDQTADIRSTVNVFRGKKARNRGLLAALRTLWTGNRRDDAVEEEPPLEAPEAPQEPSQADDNTPTEGEQPTSDPAQDEAVNPTTPQ